MSTLYVIRHAQASMFAADYDVLSDLGRRQAEQLGHALAEQLQAAGASGFDAVFTGPARRHRDTAALARAGFDAAGLTFPEPTVIDGFDEHDGQGLVMALLGRLARATSDDPPPFDLGLLALASQASDTSGERGGRARAWQQLFEAIMLRWLAGDLDLDSDSTADEIESWPTFRTRVVEAFDQVRGRARGEVALFTSVGPTAAILHDVLDTTGRAAFETAWRQYNASISRVIYSGERRTLDGFNDVGYLAPADRTHR